MYGMRSVEQIALLVWTCVALAGCGTDDVGEPAPQALVEELGTAEHVHNAAELTGVPDYILEQDLRIGVMDGPEALQFAGVRMIDEDEEGTVWVLDSRAASVRAFDADGNLLRSFGRSG
ncbi:MAG: hypothetical protein WEF86_12265 [Gemmatimonadota bacterium]